MRSLTANLVVLIAACASHAQPWELEAWRNRVEVELTEPGIAAPRILDYHRW